MAFASRLETEDHLESLFETCSIKDRDKYKDLLSRTQTLGKKLNRFIQSVEKRNNTHEE